MATNTPNYQLRKPAGSDLVNVVTDIGDNMDDIDTNLKRVDDYTLLKPLARLRQEAAQSVNASTWTALSFGAEDIDTHNGHDNSTNPSRYTVQKEGYYRLGGGSWWASNATGVRFTRWAKNGNVIENAGTDVAPLGGGSVTYVPAVDIIISAIVSDYFELMVWQNSGGSLNTAVAGGTNEEGASANIEWLRPL